MHAKNSSDSIEIQVPISGTYRKNDDIAQSTSSFEWVRRNYPTAEPYPIIIGPHNPVANQAQPVSGLKVIEIDHFVDLAKRLRTMIERVQKRPQQTVASKAIEHFLNEYGFLWPRLLTSLPSLSADDLNGQFAG